MKLPDEPWPGEYPARPQPPTETFPEFYRSCATRNKCSQPLRCWLNSTTRGQTRRAAEAARAFSFQSRGVTAITGTPRQYGPRLSIAERSSPGLRIADETVTRFQWPDPSPPISVLEKKREQNRDTSDKRPQQSRQHCSFYSSERREGGLSCVARFSFIAVGKVHIKDSEYASRGGGHTHLPH